MIGQKLGADRRDDDRKAHDDRNPARICQPQQGDGLEAGRQLGPHHHTPGQNEHADGAENHEQRAFQQAPEVGARFLLAISVVEGSPQAFDGAGREEQGDQRTHREQPEPAASHDRHDFRRQRLSHGRRRNFEQLRDTLLGKRFAAEVPRHGADEDAERKQRQHERIGHRASHRKAAVGVKGVDGPGYVLDLPNDHDSLRAGTSSAWSVSTLWKRRDHSDPPDRRRAAVPGDARSLCAAGARNE